MKKIILAGNAITANIINCYLVQDSRYEVIGLTVDDEFVKQGGINGLDTIALSKLPNIYSPKDCVVIMAMGYNDINRSRASMFSKIKSIGYSIETYIHPAARVFTDIPLGEGCVILPSAVIEPCVRIGANSMIWANVTLAHHSSVGEHCWIAAGAVVSGKAQVKRNVFLGVNSTVVNEIIIGEHCVIGAGALITKNTKDNSVHLARSAEELRYSSQDYVQHFGL